MMNYRSKQNKLYEWKQRLHLEVGLEYPKELLDLCSNCPLAPEVMNVEANILSEKQVEIYTLTNEKSEPNDEKAKKLILILNAKD